MAKENPTIDEILWPKFNETGEDIVLYEMKDPPERDAQGNWATNFDKPFVIKPGDRMKLPKQAQFLRWAMKYQEVLFGGAAGGGKVVYENDLVLTPYGFKAIQDFNVGDAVSSPDGTVGKIVQLHPWGEHQVWRVHFHDGTHLDVAEQHLWQAWRTGKKTKHANEARFGEDGARVVETATLKKWCDQSKERDAQGKRPWWPAIPVCKEQPFVSSLRFKNPIDPYVLGLILGDGCLSQNMVSITSMDHDCIRRELGALEYSTYTKQGTDAMTYAFHGETLKEMRHGLDLYGLTGLKSYDKFIPELIKRAPLEVRRAVVQGLMDTDGCVANGKVYFASSSKRLADDLAWVLRSLGAVVTTTVSSLAHIKDTYKDCHKLYIKHPNPTELFRFERKRDRAKEASIHRTFFRKVVNVEILEEKRRGRCITVSNPNGLYITNDFIVTHNSHILLMAHVFFHLYWNALGIKGANSGMFCETFPDLKKRQIMRLKERIPKWLGKYNASEYTFTFKEKFGGGVIMFCNLDDPDKYASVEFALITIDELTRNVEATYYAVKWRLRWPGIKHRPFLATTNPGRVGHSWVHKRFVRNEDPYRPKTAFIQCLPQENPFIDKEYTEDILGDQPEKIRRAMQEGRWDVFDGQFFDMLDPKVHKVRAFKIPDEVPKFFAIDHGTNHPTACMWFALFPASKEFPAGRCVIYRYYEKRGKWADKHKEEIWALMKNDKNIVSGCLSHDAFSVKGSTMGDKTVAQRYNMESTLEDGTEVPSFNVVPAGGRNRKEQWRAVLNALSFDAEYVDVAGNPVSEYYEGERRRIIKRFPQIQFLDKEDVNVAWEALTTLVHRDGDPDDLEKVCGNVYEVGQGDESADTLGMGWIHIGSPEMYLEYDEFEESTDRTRKRRREEESYAMDMSTF